MREILPGIFHWTTFHEGIQTQVHSYLVTVPEAPVLIDPRIPAEGIAWFDARRPRHVLLTNRHHYRHSRHFVERFDARIWCHRAGLHDLPEGVTAFEHGQELPGGVVAVEIGALCPEETALYVQASGVLALGDALIREDGRLRFVPEEYMGDDPAAVKRGLLAAFSRCLDLDFDGLLLAHGEPLPSGGKTALRRFVHGRGVPL